MKKFLSTLLLLLSFSVFSQEKHEPIVYITPLKGMVEIDGHTFDNDKEKDKIVFKATLSGVEIFNETSKVQYEYRKCDKKDCKIIHLLPKNTGYYSITPNIFYTNTAGTTTEK